MQVLVPKPTSFVSVVVFLCTTETHTQTFNGPFTGFTRMSRYQKGKTNLDFTEARESVAVASAGWYASLHIAPDRQPCQHRTTQYLQAGCCSRRPNNSVDNGHGNVVDNTVECWWELQRLLANLVAASKGMRAIKLCTYTVSQKTRHLTLAHKFTKYWPIFKILLDSVGNSLQSHIQISHHTLNVSLYYLVKYLCSKNRHS